MKSEEVAILMMAQATKVRMGKKVKEELPVEEQENKKGGTEVLHMVEEEDEV